MGIIFHITFSTYEVTKRVSTPRLFLIFPVARIYEKDRRIFKAAKSDPTEPMRRMPKAQIFHSVQFFKTTFNMMLLVSLYRVELLAINRLNHDLSITVNFVSCRMESAETKICLERNIFQIPDDFAFTDLTIFILVNPVK